MSELKKEAYAGSIEDQPADEPRIDVSSHKNTHAKPIKPFIDNTTSEHAQKVMAEKIESGGTPYDYTSKVENDLNKDDFGEQSDYISKAGGFSMINVLLVFIIGFSLVAGFTVWSLVKDITSQVKSMNTNVEQIAKGLAQETQISQQTTKAVTRAELSRSLAILEEIVATGDPELKRRANALKIEIIEVLSLLGNARESDKSTQQATPPVESSPSSSLKPFHEQGQTFPNDNA